jgi:hypothetical protein
MNGAFRKILLILGVGLIGWLGFEVSRGQYYTPRSSFGFYLGVAGALMMVALLSYPLRKHVRFMQRWGPLKHWFRIHMYLGIAGPTLILFHATFHVRSPNAGVALTSMLLVVASGIIGRFVYSKIHHGLFGQRATLQKIQKEFSETTEEALSRFHFCPQIDHWLKEFEESVLHAERSWLENIGSFLALGIKGRLLKWRCGWEIRKVFHHSEQSDFPLSKKEARSFVASYIYGVQQVAQFHTYERLFSLWHVLHIPLIYLLAASAIFHVIAVYMY